LLNPIQAAAVQVLVHTEQHSALSMCTLYQPVVSRQHCSLQECIHHSQLQ